VPPPRRPTNWSRRQRGVRRATTNEGQEGCRNRRALSTRGGLRVSISPQTHIIEAIGEMVKAGQLSPCEFINVESEFAAMSVSIGASAAGARAYTATASQGLLVMMEAVYNRRPRTSIVMTLATLDRSSHQYLERSQRRDGRSRRGWIQLFAETNQEAADLHVLASAWPRNSRYGHGLHGRLHPDARRRSIDVPDQRGRRRIPAELRATSSARPAHPSPLANGGTRSFTEVRYSRTCVNLMPAI